MNRMERNTLQDPRKLRNGGTVYRRGRMWHLQYSLDGTQYRQSLGTTRIDAAKTRAEKIILDAKSPSASTPKQQAPQDWCEKVSSHQADKNGWVHLLWYRAKDRGTRRGIGCDLTKRQLVELLINSNGICQVSGIPFSWDLHGASKLPPFSPTVDRIDASMPYTISNCRIVCLCVNAALGAWGDNVFSVMVSAAAKKNSCASL